MSEGQVQVSGSTHYCCDCAGYVPEGRKCSTYRHVVTGVAMDALEMRMSARLCGHKGEKFVAKADEAKPKRGITFTFDPKNFEPPSPRPCQALGCEGTMRVETYQDAPRWMCDRGGLVSRTIQGGGAVVVGEHEHPDPLRCETVGCENVLLPHQSFCCTTHSHDLQ